MTSKGLYCPAGRFHIDPSGAVEHAVVTHAHSDHARKDWWKTNAEQGYNSVIFAYALGKTQRILGELFIVPQSFLKTSQSELLGRKYRTAFASGWMAQRSGNYDHGFLMSDHADWNDLLKTIQESQAKKVFVQHRGKGALVKYLNTIGVMAFADSDLFPEHPNQLSLF